MFSTFFSAQVAWSLAPLAEFKEEFSGVQVLQVEGKFCTVKVEGHANNVLEIKAGCHNQCQFETIRQDNELKFSVVIPEDTDLTKEGDIHIRAPRSLVLKIFTNAGSVSIKNMESLGNSLVHTRAGSIWVKKYMGNISLRSSSGDCSLQTLSGRIDVRTHAGNQSILDCRGAFKLLSHSGRINLHHCEGNLFAHTRSGNIDLNHISGELIAKTVTGDVYGSELTFFGKSSFQSKSGSINVHSNKCLEDLRLYLSTKNGSITPISCKKVKNLNFVQMSREGFHEVKSQSTDKELSYLEIVSKSGNIHIYD